MRWMSRAWRGVCTPLKRGCGRAWAGVRRGLRGPGEFLESAYGLADRDRSLEKLQEERDHHVELCRQWYARNAHPQRVNGHRYDPETGTWHPETRTIQVETLQADKIQTEPTARAVPLRADLSVAGEPRLTPAERRDMLDPRTLPNGEKPEYEVELVQAWGGRIKRRYYRKI